MQDLEDPDEGFLKSMRDFPTDAGRNSITSAARLWNSFPQHFRDQTITTISSGVWSALGMGELGLLRKRTFSADSKSGRHTTASGSAFKYLIVIDFESTCWKEGKFRTQEVIEFPAVLLNTVTGEIGSEFHHYVQPQEQPVLSHFCSELTGITQAQVEDGIPLSLCLKKFTHWLDGLSRQQAVVYAGSAGDERAVNTAFVTWSDWDLGVCLQYECKRKQLLKPWQLNTWIDLRATYRKFYERKPNGLNGALQDLGIEFQGRQHSGVDDARNTAKLAHRMMRDGCVLKITKSLKDHKWAASCTASIGNTAFGKQSAEQHPNNQQHATKLAYVGKPNSHNMPPGRLTSVDQPNNQSGVPSNCCKVTNGSSGATDSDVNLNQMEVLQRGEKRKYLTPKKNKLAGNSGVSSPCRKNQRIASPWKQKSHRIYQDPEPVSISSDERAVSVGNKNMQVKTGSGLKFQNQNIANMMLQQAKHKESSEVCKTKPWNSGRVHDKFKEPAQNSNVKLNHCSHSGLSFKENTKPTSTSITPTNVQYTKSNFKVPYPPGSSTTPSGSSTTPSGSSTTTLRSPAATAGSGGVASMSEMKITPPLCRCGRRSQRRMVQSPGQNMGRFFFTCSQRRGNAAKTGCNFFKWEVA